jgi:hypothetical protein
MKGLPAAKADKSGDGGVDPDAPVTTNSGRVAAVGSMLPQTGQRATPSAGTMT